MVEKSILLTIKQNFAEQILAGDKWTEYRERPPKSWSLHVQFCMFQVSSRLSRMYYEPCAWRSDFLGISPASLRPKTICNANIMEVNS